MYSRIYYEPVKTAPNRCGVEWWSPSTTASRRHQPLHTPHFLGNSGSSSPSGLGLIRHMVYTKNVATEIQTADGAMRYPALCETL